jgi:hypothetical protein
MKSKGREGERERLRVKVNLIQKDCDTCALKIQDNMATFHSLYFPHIHVGFSSSVIGRDVLSPLDLEQIFGEEIL